MDHAHALIQQRGFTAQVDYHRSEIRLVSGAGVLTFGVECPKEVRHLPGPPNSILMSDHYVYERRYERAMADIVRQCTDGLDRRPLGRTQKGTSEWEPVDTSIVQMLPIM